MLSTLPTPSPLLFWGFVILPLLVSAGLAAAIGHTSGRAAGRRAGFVLVLWLGATGALGASGLLDTWAPPPVLGVFATIIVFLAWSARQPWTERLGDLPLKILVGFQAFRIVVEALLHLAVEEGVANPTMTWTGTNLDIIPGISALFLIPWVDRLSKPSLQAWNVGMAGILCVTVLTAVLAAPTPLRQIAGEPPNVFVAAFPFVWLPATLVMTAWLGHIVLFRRLRRN